MEILEQPTERRQVSDERGSALLSTRQTVVADMTAGAKRFADVINAEHRAARQKFAEHAIRCGELLLEQKQRVGYGNFGKWIEAHCEFSIATANNYMKVAKNPNALGKTGAIRRLYPSGFADAPKKLSTKKSREPEKSSSSASPPLPSPQPAPESLAALGASAHPAPMPKDLTADQALEILRRQEDKQPGRLLRAYHAAKRDLERAQIAYNNAVASIQAAARKIEETRR